MLILLSILTVADADRIARSVFALQTSPTSPWYPECGDLLDSLHSSGTLSEELWKQYAANAAPRMSLTIRPRVRLGDPIAYQIKYPPAQVGSKSRFISRDLDCQIRIADVAVKGFSGFTSGLSQSDMSWSTSAVQPQDYQRRLQPGHHHFTITRKQAIQTESGENAPPLAISTTTLEGDFNLLPADQPTVTLIDDPSLEPPIRKPLTPHLRINSEGTLNVTTNVLARPAGIGLHATIITGSTRHDVGALALPADRQTTFGHGSNHNWPADQKTATILYEPDIQAVAGTVDVFEIYNRPIQFDDIPITR